jgi:soluble lytic murein transglycosylase
MKRLVIVILALLLVACGLYLFNQYWVHRYDTLLARQASQHRIDPDLVWSIVYEETYFSPWKKGRNGEVGLMQVTPVVAREWAAETAATPLEQRMLGDMTRFLRDPEQNVEIGCWYLAKFSEEYRDTQGREARMLAAYNAGDSRASEWNRPAPGAPALTEQEFISRIDIPSTRAYVTSILDRFRRVKAARGTSPSTLAR